MKEITLKDIEEAIKTVGIPEYPKYLGNGLWELYKGIYGNDKAAEELDKAIVEQVKKDYKELVEDNKKPVVIDLEGVKIFFKEDND